MLAEKVNSANCLLDDNQPAKALPSNSVIHTKAPSTEKKIPAKNLPTAESLENRALSKHGVFDAHKMWPGKRKWTLTLYCLTVETVYYPFSIRLKWFV